LYQQTSKFPHSLTFNRSNCWNINFFSLTHICRIAENINGSVFCFIWFNSVALRLGSISSFLTWFLRWNKQGLRWHPQFRFQRLSSQARAASCYLGLWFWAYPKASPLTLLLPALTIDFLPCIFCHAKIVTKWSWSHEFFFGYIIPLVRGRRSPFSFCE
jgi:hypothetical protein